MKVIKCKSEKKENRTYMRKKNQTFEQTVRLESKRMDTVNITEHCLLFPSLPEGNDSVEALTVSLPNQILSTKK